MHFLVSANVADDELPVVQASHRHVTTLQDGRICRDCVRRKNSLIRKCDGLVIVVSAAQAIEPERDRRCFRANAKCSRGRGDPISEPIGRQLALACSVKQWQARRGIKHDIVDRDFVAREHQGAVVVVRCVEYPVVFEGERDVEAHFQRIIVEVDDFVSLNNRIDCGARAVCTNNNQLPARQTWSRDPAPDVGYEVCVCAGEREMDGAIACIGRFPHGSHTKTTRHRDIDVAHDVVGVCAAGQLSVDVEKYWIRLASRIVRNRPDLIAVLGPDQASAILQVGDVDASGTVHKISGSGIRINADFFVDRCVVEAPGNRRSIITRVEHRRLSREAERDRLRGCPAVRQIKEFQFLEVIEVVDAIVIEQVPRSI